MIHSVSVKQKLQSSMEYSETFAPGNWLVILRIFKNITVYYHEQLSRNNCQDDSTYSSFQWSSQQSDPSHWVGESDPAPGEVIYDLASSLKVSGNSQWHSQKNISWIIRLIEKELCPSPEILTFNIIIIFKVYNSSLLALNNLNWQKWQSLKNAPPRNHPRWSAHIHSLTRKVKIEKTQLGKLNMYPVTIRS